MSDLDVRAARKRVTLPSQFTHPVLIESAAVHGEIVIARIRRPDGGLEDVTLDVAELEDALARAAIEGPEIRPGDQVFGSLEATRIRLAYHFDPYFAVSLSGVRALPHQLEAVYERLLPQPRIRSVLAHDPGAGKTIMTGLLIKELKIRGAIDRVLILVPAPITAQWQDELQDKFDETFEIVDSHVDTGQVAGNIWQRKPLCIASIDYAKRDASDSPDNPGRSVRDAILQCSWDLVIVDEAHKASAAKYGDEVKPTKRYRLIEELSRSPQVNHLLLLTATPHQGKEEAFRLFLRLLDPDQFESLDMGRIRALLGEDRCPFFMRRVKEDLRDFDGRKLFLPRNAWTEAFELQGEEKQLYEEVGRYIKDFLGQSYDGRRKMAVALARSVLQRRLASSLNAISESLRRRETKLTTLLEEVERLPAGAREKRLAEAGLISLDTETVDDDEESEQIRDEAVAEVTVANTVEGLRREVAAVSSLHAKAAGLRDAALADPTRECKLAALKKCLDRSNFAELRERQGKLLIFTEHKDTLDHQEHNLREWGYSVVTIHGGQNAADRKERQRRFRQEDQICVATDAAGESINLQFCHLMINYDVPWNPNRLEQRMGRIHRIGQDREVHVFNFVAVNTEEGRVLKALIDKMQAIRKDLRSDRIFDVIGNYLRVEGLNPEEVLREVAVNPKRAEDFVNDIERLTREQLERFEQATSVALARRQLDLGQFRQSEALHEDLRLMPEYVERFFRQAASAVGLTVEERADGLLRIPSVPHRLRAPTLRSVQRYGPARDRYLKVTFRKDQRKGKNDDADLLSPGHPLYAALVELYEDKLGPVEGGTALFRDGRADRPYYLHAFEIGVVGETAGPSAHASRAEPIDSRFVPLIEQLDGSYEIASQDIFHELLPLAVGEAEEVAAETPPGSVQVGPMDPERIQRASTWLRARVQHPMVQEQRRRRAEEAGIRRQYLEESFDARVNRLDQDRYRLLAQVDAGEQGAAGRLAQLEDQRQQTERLKGERLRALDRLGVARAGIVRHLASVIVLPVETDEETHRLLRSDPVVERIAMEAAMAEERRRGWSPEDVSQLKDGRGYDILSFGPDSAEGARPIRRIEVKGRSGDGGDVALTTNEWLKAQRLRMDYWLYVVYDAREGATPRLVAIQDPAHAFASACEKLTVVKGWRVPGLAIAAFGAK